MSDDAPRANEKPEHLDRLSSVWRRIYERKLVQWSVAYVALAYAIQHSVVLTEEAFEWPHAVQQISMLLLVLGLPVVMTFAWYHGERASRRISGPELTIIAILLAIGSLFFYVLVRPAEEAVASRAPVEGIAAARSAALNPATALSIAVLPFDNISGDASQEFFSDGMTEEITAALAKVPDLRVVARTSAFQFKAQNRDIQSIGQQLHATHFIEGSVRRAGTRVRITAQLIKADDGSHVWAENYDRELTDVFAIQEDIARAITASLRVPLGLKQGESLVSSRAADTASYQDYLRAKGLVRARGLKPLTDGAALLEQVVGRDPNYAPAWALLAMAYDLIPNYGPGWLSGDVAEARRAADASLPKAEAAAQRAIQLDSKSADGYAALALAQALRGKLLASEEVFSKALALDPNNPDALHQYSQILAETGRLKEALAMRQRLQALEPFLPIVILSTADVLWLNGQNDDAIAMLRDLPTDVALRMIFLARIYASVGRYNEAADTLLEIAPGTFSPGTLEESIRLLRTAPTAAVSPQSLRRLGYLDFTYLHIGAQSRTLEFHEGNLEAGYSIQLGVATLWHPSYSAVRKTERFKALMRKVGVVAYWRAKGWPSQCHPTTGDDFACE